MEVYKNMIGERIKKLRKEVDFTQEELSTRLGLNNKSSISQYEKGDIVPSDDVKLKMCEIFNCSLDYLMCKTDIKNYNKDEHEFHSKYHKEIEGLTDEEIADALRFYKEMKKKVKGDN